MKTQFLVGVAALSLMTIVGRSLTAQTSDTRPPQVSITRPMQGASVGVKTEVDFWAYDWGGLNGYYYLYCDGDLVGTLTPRSKNRYFSWRSGAEPAGAHDITVVAQDRAGNVGTSYPVTVICS